MAKKAAEAPLVGSRTFHGRPIRESVVAIGIGGEIALVPEDPGLPDEATVTFQAEARVDSNKFKFQPDGSAKEVITLVIDRETFKIQKVVEKPPDPQMSLDEAGEPEKPLSIAQAAAQEDTE